MDLLEYKRIYKREERELGRAVDNLPSNLIRVDEESATIVADAILAACIGFVSESGQKRWSHGWQSKMKHLIDNHTSTICYWALNGPEDIDCFTDRYQGHDSPVMKVIQTLVTAGNYFTRISCLKELCRLLLVDGYSSMVIPVWDGDGRHVDPTNYWVDCQTIQGYNVRNPSEEMIAALQHQLNILQENLNDAQNAALHRPVDPIFDEEHVRQIEELMNVNIAINQEKVRLQHANEIAEQTIAKHEKQHDDDSRTTKDQQKMFDRLQAEYNVQGRKFAETQAEMANNLIMYNKLNQQLKSKDIQIDRLRLQIARIQDDQTNQQNNVSERNIKLITEQQQQIEKYNEEIQNLTQRLQDIQSESRMELANYQMTVRLHEDAAHTNQIKMDNQLMQIDSLEKQLQNVEQQKKELQTILTALQQTMKLREKELQATVTGTAAATAAAATIDTQKQLDDQRKWMGIIMTHTMRLVMYLARLISQLGSIQQIKAKAALITAEEFGLKLIPGDKDSEGWTFEYTDNFNSTAMLDGKLLQLMLTGDAIGSLLVFSTVSLMINPSHSRKKWDPTPEQMKMLKLWRDDADSGFTNGHVADFINNPQSVITAWHHYCMDAIIFDHRNVREGMSDDTTTTGVRLRSPDDRPQQISVRPPRSDPFQLPRPRPLAIEGPPQAAAFQPRAIDNIQVVVPLNPDQGGWQTGYNYKKKK